MSRGWLIAFATAGALFALGLVLDEAGQIFMNAASLCLACLGIG